MIKTITRLLSRVGKPRSSNIFGMQPRLFADEYLVHRRYLRAILHLRPVMQVDCAWIEIGEQKIDLSIDPKEDHINLQADALISSIKDAHAAIVKVSSRKSVIEFSNFVEETALPNDNLRRLQILFQNKIYYNINNIDVLEIGSRNRQATRNSFLLRNVAKSYIGIDIIDGNNVDVVGDAHRLSTYFGRNRFDLVYSQWVWEHLAMPWVACAELNKVLRVGGEVFILTNHTMALHDLPWDFFRFSDSTWISFFNEATGFEIVGSAMGDGMRIVPHRYHAAHIDHEGGLGYLASGVWARKTRDVDMSWPVDPDLIFSKLARQYPREITD